MTMKYNVLACIIIFIVFVAIRPVNATADGCAVVLRTPDGFLNVRAAPKMGAQIVARLKPGDIIDVNETNCEGSVCDEKIDWVHVHGVPRLDGQKYQRGVTKGWAGRRFIVFVDCDSLTAPTTADK
jgi:Bacterial SH3 domain